MRRIDTTRPGGARIAELFNSAILILAADLDQIVVTRIGGQGPRWLSPAAHGIQRKAGSGEENGGGRIDAARGTR